MGCDLLGGFKHEVLPQLGKAERTGTFTPFNYGIGRRLRERKFDALWVHGYSRPTNLLAMAEAFRAGVRVLVRDEANLQGRPRARKAMGQASLKRMSTWDYEADVRALREGLTRLFSRSSESDVDNDPRLNVPANCSATTSSYNYGRFSSFPFYGISAIHATHHRRRCNSKRDNVHPRTNFASRRYGHGFDDYKPHSADTSSSRGDGPRCHPGGRRRYGR